MHTHTSSVYSRTHIFSNILEENYMRKMRETHTESDRPKLAFLRLNLTDDRSVVELLDFGRCAQKRSAEAGGQRRQRRCSRPTHSTHTQDDSDAKLLEMLGGFAGLDGKKINTGAQFVHKNIKRRTERRKWTDEDEDTDEDAAFWALMLCVERSSVSVLLWSDSTSVQPSK